MKKIPTIFLRDETGPSRVTDTPHPDCGWVFAGEGKETCKWDGTCCSIDYEGRLWKRREVKSGIRLPDRFIVTGTDKNTGKIVGWMRVDPNDTGDKWHVEAIGDRGFFGGSADKLMATKFESIGTYELLGPKVQGNPYGLDKHILVQHGKHSPGVAVLLMSRDPFSCCRDALSIAAKAGLGIEGVVWHHPDGRMAKIKSRDFGIDWKANGVFKP